MLHFDSWLCCNAKSCAEAFFAGIAALFKKRKKRKKRTDQTRELSEYWKDMAFPGVLFFLSWCSRVNFIWRCRRTGFPWVRRKRIRIYEMGCVG